MHEVKSKSITSTSINSGRLLSSHHNDIASHANEGFHSLSYDPYSFIPNTPVPDEIALFILSYLDLKSVRLLSRVSKKWHKLINDRDIWRQLFQRHTQGNLWRYLFENPDTGSYGTYLKEIFLAKEITYDNFEDSFNSIKDKFIEGIGHFKEKGREIREEYFKDRQSTVLKQELATLVKMTASLTESIRKTFFTSLAAFLDINMLPYDHHNILMLLYRINLIDTLMTDVMYFCKFVNSDPSSWPSQWLCNPIQNRLVSGRGLAALSAYAQYTKDSIAQRVLQDPTLAHILNRLAEKDLICCSAHSYRFAENVLRHSSLVNRISDKGLLAIFLSTNYITFANNFYDILEKNKSLLSRLSGRMLVKLKKKRPRLSFLIANHPILIHRLNEDQLVTIVESLDSKNAQALLNGEVFWSITVEDISEFLLRLFIEEIFKNDKALLRLSPSKVFLAATHRLRVADALTAQHNIILEKLTQSELAELALNKHFSVAINLLQNPQLTNRWDLDTLEDIKKKFKNSEAPPQLNVLIGQIMTQRTLHAFSSPYRTRFVTKAMPTDNNLFKYDHVSTDFLESDRNIKTTFRPSAATKKNHTFPSFSLLKKIGLAALILLGIASLLLLATGIGALVGAAGIISVLTAVNVLNLSMSSLATVLTVWGVGSTLTTARLGVYYFKNTITNFLYPKNDHTDGLSPKTANGLSTYAQLFTNRRDLNQNLTFVPSLNDPCLFQSAKPFFLSPAILKPSPQIETAPGPRKSL